MFFPGLLKGQLPHLGHRWPCLRPERPPLAPRYSPGSQRACQLSIPTSPRRLSGNGNICPLSNPVVGFKFKYCQLPESWSRLALFPAASPAFRTRPTQSFSHCLLVHSLTQQRYLSSLAKCQALGNWPMPRSAPSPVAGLGWEEVAGGGKSALEAQRLRGEVP